MDKFGPSSDIDDNTLAFQLLLAEEMLVEADNAVIEATAKRAGAQLRLEVLQRIKADLAFVGRDDLFNR